MKIAIRGHELRGKEVIQILESLGGKNKYFHRGISENYFYELRDDCIWCTNTRHEYFKYYTLEEFEKEFPFKVGDVVILKENGKYPHTIKSLSVWSDGDIVCKFEDTGLHYSLNKLKYYKEMKEERNITLTLDKAKEWYNKGGDLKQVALQAFSKEELTKVELTKVELPKTWEEFCTKYSKTDDKECFIDSDSNIKSVNSVILNHSRLMISDRNICPSKESAEAHLAMIQLEQLRNCWRQGWKPTKYDTGYCIIQYPKEYLITSFCFISFLSFPTKEMAEKFFKCFRDLIEKAGDLI